MDIIQISGLAKLLRPSNRDFGFYTSKSTGLVIEVLNPYWFVDLSSIYQILKMLGNLFLFFFFLNAMNKHYSHTMASKKFELKSNDFNLRILLLDPPREDYLFVVSLFTTSI